MYGGLDRSAIPELKEGDEEFISNVTEEYGSRERAAGKFADQGFAFYNRGNDEMAMRRFNQGWLLDPEMSDNYWGFAAILYGRKKSCEAAGFMEIALSKNVVQHSMYADAAEIYGACVGTGHAGDKEQEYRSKVTSLVNKVMQSPIVSKGYAYSKWINALYHMKEYKTALEKLYEYEEITGQNAPEEFREELIGLAGEDA
jgi:tetratricopeptide (TPR) repeat protein